MQIGLLSDSHGQMQFYLAGGLGFGFRRSLVAFVGRLVPCFEVLFARRTRRDHANQVLRHFAAIDADWHLMTREQLILAPCVQPLQSRIHVEPRSNG